MLEVADAKTFASLADRSFVVTAASAQQPIEISEPSMVALSDLFKQADIVAVVQILTGDSESYGSAVYKSKVLMQFKGAADNEELYFGPFIGYGVNEYVAFLRHAKSGPKLHGQRLTNTSIAYGAVEVFSSDHVSGLQHHAAPL